MDDEQVEQTPAEASAGGSTRRLRPEVRASWDRSARVGLAPDRHLPPVALGEDDIRRRRREPRLAAAWQVLLAHLGSVVAEPGHLVFAGDADGHLLWVLGKSVVRRAAERAHLVVGADWSESAVGTNAIGTALATGKPFQVRGGEHYLPMAVDYTCTAAPIRDPSTRAILGVVDVTCPQHHVRPMVMPLVTAAARLAEAHLADLAHRRDSEIRTRYLDRVLRRSGTRAALLSPDGRVVHAEPSGWLPRTWPWPLEDGAFTLPDGQRVTIERLTSDGPFALYSSRDSDPVAHVRALGRKFATVRIDGVDRRLGLRHSEIVALLLADPEGMSASSLAHELYGATGKPVTVRVELGRLRALLGYRLVANPYRLIDTTADFVDLEHDLATAPGTADSPPYPGPLLPTSRAPGIVRLRNALHQRMTTGLHTASGPVVQPSRRTDPVAAVGESFTTSPGRVCSATHPAPRRISGR